MPDLLTSDGIRLSERRWPAHPVASATVVLVHGFTGSKDHPDLVAVAQALVGAGYGVLSYDARGHHDSDGLCTLGESEELDVAAAVAEARSVSKRVVTVGASMGGIAVLRHARTDPTLNGVVTVSTPAEWKLPRNIQGLFSMAISQTGVGRWWAERRLGVRLDSGWNHPPPPVKVAADIRSPLAVVHGAADRMIPASEAKRLARGAGGPTRLEIVEGMGHSFDRRGIPAIVGAVRWVLDPGHDSGVVSA
ncbi:MAG: alpha/beta fold hydrolase [Acidimicrobiia bacterium]